MDNVIQKFNNIGKVAIITGGAGLLGKEFSKTLAESGATVIVADLNVDAASEIADSLVQSGHKAQGYLLDVTEKYSVSSLVSSVKKEFSRIDILVNSAALDPKFDPAHQTDADSATSDKDSTFENFPLEVWNAAIHVNLTGVFLCCQAVAGTMLEQGNGVMINIASMYGLVGPDQRLYQQPGKPIQYKPAYYSVSKAGLLGLTRYLAAYYAGKNIRVNALTPGGVFNQHDSEFIKAYSSRSILGRMADVDEMNGALLYLASDASSYMTGANLVVDGGWTAW